MLRWLAFSVAAPGLAGCDLEDGHDRPERIWGVHGTSDGWLHRPRAAAFDENDQLYIADLTDRIQVFDRDGTFLRSWRMPALNIDGPSGVNVDRLGRVLVADTHFYRVLIYTREGQLIDQVGEGVQGSKPGRFVYATDAVIDREENLIVCEYGDFDRVQVFSPKGQFLRQWGGHGYEPGQFTRPRGMVIDESDRLYVADSCNHRDSGLRHQRECAERVGRPGDQAGADVVSVRYQPGSRRIPVCLRVRQQPGSEIHEGWPVGGALGASGTRSGRAGQPVCAGG